MSATLDPVTAATIATATICPHVPWVDTQRDNVATRPCCGNLRRLLRLGDLDRFASEWSAARRADEATGTDLQAQPAAVGTDGSSAVFGLDDLPANVIPLRRRPDEPF